MDTSITKHSVKECLPPPDLPSQNFLSAIVDSSEDAFAKEIIERHNGRIRLSSEPGKGSTFYFTLNQKK